MCGKESIVNVDGVDGAQIGERFFRRAKAKTQGNLGGFPRLLPKTGGKSAAKMRTGGPISVYKRKTELPITRQLCDFCIKEIRQTW